MANQNEVIHVVEHFVFVNTTVQCVFQQESFYLTMSFSCVLEHSRGPLYLIKFTSWW